MSTELEVYLLRAVNLGAKNKVPMPRLRELLDDAGAADVSTYIASGNVFCRPPGDRDAFARMMEQLIADEFDVTTTAIARTGPELRAARAAFPFDVHDPKICAISFLADEPSAEAVQMLAEQDFAPDRCQVIGRDLHLRYENGVHKTRITTARVRRILGGEGTARNLRTVEKLADLAGA